MINEFKGPYRFLSNFYPSIIVYCNISYPTVEHFFQAMKTTDGVARKRIAAYRYPGQAKKAGRGLVLRPDWEDIKIKVMAYGLRQKFEGTPLGIELVKTYPHALIEGNYWHDNYWGDCLCAKCSSGAGENLLGKILQCLRTHLINGTLRAAHDPDF